MYQYLLSCRHQFQVIYTADGETFHSLVDLPQASHQHCLVIIDEDKMAVTAAQPDFKAVRMLLRNQEKNILELHRYYFNRYKLIKTTKIPRSSLIY